MEVGRALDFLQGRVHCPLLGLELEEKEGMWEWEAEFHSLFVYHSTNNQPKI